MLSYDREAVTLISFCLPALMLMSVASVAILRIQARQNKFRLRISSVVGTYRPRLADAVPTSGVGLVLAKGGLGPLLGRIFGFDLARQDHYKLRWWVALIATLIVAILSTKLASGLTGHLIWFALPFEWVMLSRSFFNWCRDRRRDKLFTQFPDALAMIVRAVRVGIPVTDSIHAVGRELAAPTGPEFTRLSDELAMGVVMEDALRAMAERNGLQEYRFFATTLSLQNQTGGGLSETLDNLADVIRKRVAVRQKGAALSAEAKMSSIVLAALPPLAAVGLWLMNSAYITMLFVEPLGQKILTAAILTLGFGIMAMRFLIRKSLS
jgi:tight adherence protein B